MAVAAPALWPSSTRRARGALVWRGRGGAVMTFGQRCVMSKFVTTFSAPPSAGCSWTSFQHDISFSLFQTRGTHVAMRREWDCSTSDVYPESSKSSSIAAALRDETAPSPSPHSAGHALQCRVNPLPPLPSPRLTISIRIRIPARPSLRPLSLVRFRYLPPRFHLHSRSSSSRPLLHHLDRSYPLILKWVVSGAVRVDERGDHWGEGGTNKPFGAGGRGVQCL